MRMHVKKMFNSRAPQIGCGLVRIGRVWGIKEMKVPREEAALDFLRHAFEMGVRIFDTAPSYGKSEERLGKFLAALDFNERRQCFVATKCGEEYDLKSGSARIDHSLDGLRKSIERSLGRLPSVSLLQLHKATAALLRNESVRKLLRTYKGKHVPFLGVCATNPEVARIALASDLFDFIQFPYNAGYPEMKPFFAAASGAGKTVFVSRPFASGALFAAQPGDAAEKETARHSLAFILKEMKWGGAVLVGTNSAEHLAENIKLFHELASR